MLFVFFLISALDSCNDFRPYDMLSWIFMWGKRELF
jgi:hypothetical protein